MENTPAGGMIRLKFIDGLACPFFYCAVCGEEVKDGTLSMVAWDMNAEPNAELHVVHKVDRHCLLNFEKAIEDAGGSLGTIELGEFVANLMSNSGYDMGPADHVSGLGTHYPKRPFRKKQQG